MLRAPCPPLPLPSPGFAPVCSRRIIPRRSCWPRHTFGTHGWGLRREIDGCNEALRRAGVTAIRWFRAPVGLKNIFLEPTLVRRGMRCVGWSVRGRDGVTCDPETVARRVGTRVSPGSIVLLHEG